MNTTEVRSMVIKESPALFGIRFWADFDPRRTKTLVIYEYYGEDAKGIHYFRRRGTSILVAKYPYELHANLQFFPFLMDTKVIREALGEES